MKGFLYIAAGVFLVACNKKDEMRNNPGVYNPPGGILTRHQWYFYSDRTVTFLDSNNSKIADTTVFYTNQNCTQPNYLKLNVDSTASIEMNCGTFNLLPGAHWRLWADSSFYVYIPFSRISYGTGAIGGNLGIQSCKLLNFNDQEFITNVTRIYWVCYPCVKYREERYMTYKAR